ncbi:putative toxin-antitoxin system toxin component, PIN family [Cognataquiflexum rubidum]|uniref:putative toxin-antitoxin system toxin component, PIN family n=1 Tax=Cognataquiflexum rubidum TaxID=2922273 RepID=UPI001F1452E9|nr:putative toxin-antitoxin system toxin component, PIN family [Cognataquiflexum rubidum]MCH6233344.1 putative toxin-antitoxin system toxin component, PIN family [Cognataquiflexum rubidum]
MKKVVIDTNVLLVSISDRSSHHWIFQKLVTGQFQLFITSDILFEYREIISSHMGTTASESILGVLENLQNVNFINSYYKFELIKKDFDDNKFVDCAIAANADFIVTEDKDFKILRSIPFPRVDILNIKEFEILLKDSNS